MKTAMQEIAEAFREMPVIGFCEWLHESLTELTKKEKQQIIDAYWGGLNGSMNDYTEKKTKPGGGAELYFNETYAGKKKVKNNPK